MGHPSKMLFHFPLGQPGSSHGVEEILLSSFDAFDVFLQKLEGLMQLKLQGHLRNLSSSSPGVHVLVQVAPLVHLQARRRDGSDGQSLRS